MIKSYSGSLRDVLVIEHLTQTITDRWGVVYQIHSPSICLGQPCAFHNPKKHHMWEWPWMLNGHQNYMMFRLCSHNQLHPDPDSVDFFVREMGYCDVVHSCCEEMCCHITQNKYNLWV